MVDAPCMGCDCCRSWLWKDEKMAAETRRMFEAFLNRIYNVSQFERLGPPSETEREIIDNYLERDNDGSDNEK